MGATEMPWSDKDQHLPNVEISKRRADQELYHIGLRCIDIDKRVIVLETKLEHTQRDMHGIKEQIKHVLDRVTSTDKTLVGHVVQEEKDRFKLLLGVFSAASGAVGTLLVLLIQNGVIHIGGP